MALPVYVYTDDEYLFLKVRVLAEENGMRAVRIWEEDGVYPVCLWDIDKKGGGKIFPEYAHTRLLTVTRDAVSQSVQLPLANSALISFLKGESEGKVLSLDEKKRIAHIYGEEVRLTELECALLVCLMAHNGECVTNEELVEHLWGGQASAGAVNVYIHYLREKLEMRGERVILSRRGKGYFIDRKFLKGEGLC